MELPWAIPELLFHIAAAKETFHTGCGAAFRYYRRYPTLTLTPILTLTVTLILTLTLTPHLNPNPTLTPNLTLKPNPKPQP